MNEDEDDGCLEEGHFTPHPTSVFLPTPNMAVGQLFALHIMLIVLVGVLLCGVNVGAGSEAIASVTTAAAAAETVVTWVSLPALANQTVQLATSAPNSLTNGTVLALCFEDKDGGIAPITTASSLAQCTNVTLFQVHDRGAKFIMPPHASTAAAAWSLREITGASTAAAVAAAAASIPPLARLNDAEPWWTTCAACPARGAVGAACHRSARGIMASNLCRPGAVLRVMGRALALAPGNGGRCIGYKAAASNHTLARLAQVNGTGVIELMAMSSSCHEAEFMLPSEGLPAGNYTLTVRNTLPGSAWTTPRTDLAERIVSVGTAASSTTTATVASTTSIFAVPAGNVTALKLALSSAAPGSTVELSPGTYFMAADDRLTVPASVTLRGAGMQCTILKWPMQTGAGCLAMGWARDVRTALVSGASTVPAAEASASSAYPGWALEDMTVLVSGGLQQNKTRAMCPIVAPCSRPYNCQTWVRGMALRRVNISAIAPRSVSGVDMHSGGVGMGAAVELGADASITDSVVEQDGDCGSNVTPMLQIGSKRVTVARNTLRFGCTLFSMRSATHVLWENNTATFLPGGRDGSVAATFGAPERLEYVAFLGNVQTDNPVTPMGAPHRLEGFTLDGGGGAYTGRLAASATTTTTTTTTDSSGSSTNTTTHATTTITLASDPFGPGSGGYNPNQQREGAIWRGGAVLILEGRGAGQWRRVTSNRGRVWGVDRAFDVEPDATSLVQIAPTRAHILLVGNTYNTALTVQLYGMCLGAVVRGNTLKATPLLAWGRNPHFWGYQPNWQVELSDNTLPQSAGLRLVTCDQKWNICNEGANSAGLFNGALVQGVVVRNNSLSGGAGIVITGTSADVIVEGNRITTAAGTTSPAIAVNSSHSQFVLLRANDAPPSG